MRQFFNWKSWCFFLAIALISTDCICFFLWFSSFFSGKITSTHDLLWRNPRVSRLWSWHRKPDRFVRRGRSRVLREWRELDLTYSLLYAHTHTSTYILVYVLLCNHISYGTYQWYGIFYISIYISYMYIYSYVHIYTHVLVILTLQ